MEITKTLLINAACLLIPPVVVVLLLRHFFPRKIRWSAGVVALVDLVIFWTDIFYYESVWLTLFFVVIQLKELGILKSIGMTPRQIHMMIVYEARWLSVLPILVSVGLGYLFSYGVLAAYSDLTQEVTGSRITASFSPWVAVVSMILSFLTVCLAASGPARQMGKLRPIEAVKESWSNPSLKKSAKHPILKKCFGFLGNISANSMTANKRLFRTCTVTLSLCMLLMFSFLAVFSVSDINNTKAEQDSHFNVNLTMESGQKIEPALMEELKQLPHIEEQATYTMANCALWVSESELSEEFLSSGGFDTKAAGEYVAKRDGCYRIPCVLIGLEQDAYEDYLMQSGVTYSEQGDCTIWYHWNLIGSSGDPEQSVSEKKGICHAAFCGVG